MVDPEKSRRDPQSGSIMFYEPEPDVCDSFMVHFDWDSDSVGLHFNTLRNLIQAAYSYA